MNDYTPSGVPRQIDTAMITEYQALVTDQSLLSDEVAGELQSHPDVELCRDNMEQSARADRRIGQLLHLMWMQQEAGEERIAYVMREFHQVSGQAESPRVTVP